MHFASGSTPADNTGNQTTTHPPDQVSLKPGWLERQGKHSEEVMKKIRKAMPGSGEPTVAPSTPDDIPDDNDHLRSDALRDAEDDAGEPTVAPSTGRELEEAIPSSLRRCPKCGSKRLAERFIDRETSLRAENERLREENKELQDSIELMGG